MWIKLVRFFGGTEVLASFSGAMLFICSQRNYHGVIKFIMFFISFVMGLLGAGTTASILTHYLNGIINVDKEMGAFFTSALVVTVSIQIIKKTENYLSRNNK